MTGAEKKSETLPYGELSASKNGPYGRYGNEIDGPSNEPPYDRKAVETEARLRTLDIEHEARVNGLRTNIRLLEAALADEGHASCAREAQLAHVQGELEDAEANLKSACAHVAFQEKERKELEEKLAEAASSGWVRFSKSDMQKMLDRIERELTEGTPAEFFDTLRVFEATFRKALANASAREAECLSSTKKETPT